MEKKRIIVGVSGASGVQLAQYLLLELSRHEDIETHLVVSPGARRTWELECTDSFEEFCDMADVVYDDRNMAAAISSGSFVTAGMIVIPCSMRTLSGIANAFDDNLVIRAANVCLKEGRKVVLVPREMPLGRAHIRNMLSAHEIGCAIVPPVLTFYNGPMSVDDQVRHVVGKCLRQLDIEPSEFHAWEGA